MGMKISGKERSSSCIITKPLRHSTTDRSTPVLLKMYGYKINIDM
jgi:hypothetical protein